MGQVISLDEHRRNRRVPETDPAGRLERAVGDLEAALRRIHHPAGAAVVESEILAITGAVSIGLLEEAADRAERLAGRLGTRERPGS